MQGRVRGAHCHSALNLSRTDQHFTVAPKIVLLGAFVLGLSEGAALLAMARGGSHLLNLRFRSEK